MPSAPAPSLVVDLPNGTGFAGEITLQGILVDPDAENGQGAVTNAIVVRSLSRSTR